MTIEELYQNIGGSYENAIRVLRMDKLIDKHIRKFIANGVVENLLQAGETMDPTELFETSHAMKGVCGNLGLTNLYVAASEISEEFRPGNERHFTDDEVKEKLQAISELYQKTADGIRAYEEANQ